MAKKNIKETEKSLEKRAYKSVGTRGRIFEGVVTGKFPKRVSIEFERTVFIKKYERFAKKYTRIHARLPEPMESEIEVGDRVQAQECRPLSKLIHFVVIKKVSSGGTNEVN